MLPKRGKVYLGGGSWIVSGPVIDGPISGEVGAAGAGAAAPACPGAGGATAGGGGYSRIWSDLKDEVREFE